MSALAELVEFLKHSSTEVRQNAVEMLVGVSTQAETLEFFQKNSDAIQIVFSLTHDNPIVAHDAYRAMINLSGREAIAKHFENKVIFGWLAHTVLKRDSILADLACMLLANLTKRREAFNLLHNTQVDTGNGNSSTASSKPGAAISAFVHAFAMGRQYNSRADFHYLASVFANITQYVEARQLLIADENDNLLRFLLPSLSSEYFIRRGGVASTLKNCLFDTSIHDRLCEKYELLRHVFVPLAIRSDFLDDELAKAPQCIKDLPEAKKRESDEGIRLVLLEVLLMIGSTRNGRERMRNDQVYSMIRNFHREGGGNYPEPIEEAIDGVVNMLIRDEEPEPRSLPVAAEPKDDEITLVE